MSANVFDERFLAREKPAWWDYENNHTFDGDREMTATSAVSAAGLDYRLEKKANYVNAGGQEIPTGYYSIVREAVGDEEEPTILPGTVSEQYGLLQNEDIARIVEDVSTEWPVETIGALGKGERMFIVLDAGKAEVGPADDTVEGYYLVTDNKIGGGKLTAAFTPTRVVCMNTLQIGLSSANIRIDLEHTSNVEQQLELVHGLMTDLRQGQSETFDAFDAMARANVTSENLEEILHAAYPLPEPSAKVQTAMELEGQLDEVGEAEAQLVRETLKNFRERQDRQQAMIDEGLKRHEAFNERNPAIANTVWSAYNAVAEMESWRSSTNESIRARSVLLGDRGRTIEAAFDQAVQMI